MLHIKKRGKKGSLNLSINAIVVLIMAVTLLSLGLTFINSTFGGATSTLDDSLKGLNEQRIEQLKSKCQEDVCLESSSLTIERNKEETVLAVLNNKLDCDITAATISIGGPNQETCQIIGVDPSELSTRCKNDIKISTFNNQPIDRKTKVILPVDINPKNNAESSTYRYPVEVSGSCQNSEMGQKLFLDVVVE